MVINHIRGGGAGFCLVVWLFKICIVLNTSGDQLFRQPLLCVCAWRVGYSVLPHLFLATVMLLIWITAEIKMYSTTHYCVYITAPKHPSKSGIKSHNSSVRSPDYVCVTLMCACARVGGGGEGGGDAGHRLSSHHYRCTTHDQNNNVW